MLQEEHIIIEENAPRDGLQNESVCFSVKDRVALIDSLSACGFKRIQIGAFVNPRWVPQMAETEKVYERIRRIPGVAYTALLFNERGLERALSCGMEHVAMFVSASEEHSRRNNNCSVKDATDLTVRLIHKAKNHGLRVQAGVMNAFGCRFEGWVPVERVMGIVRLLLEAGPDEISLADTSGIANPRQVEGLVRSFKEISATALSLHLHDTFGFGLANAYAAWKSGVRIFDSSCGGLGGCPFIPGAGGNIASEDIVHLFESMGIPTGISLEMLAQAVLALETRLQRTLPGRFARLRRVGTGEEALMHGQKGECHVP